MKKKLFVVSDIHNNYTALRKALKKAGYDGRKNHLLIVLGDEFDRKPCNQSHKLFKYLKQRTDSGKAIVIKGNHCDMLQDYLDGTSVSLFNFIYNGTNVTLNSFYGDGNMGYDELGYFDIKHIVDKVNKNYPELLPWLKERPYYFETENYIFTHGTIDGFCEDWHNPKFGWEKCTWAEPKDFCNEIYNTNKTVVVGHIHCGMLRELYGKNENDNSIFTRPDGKVIGIDTCTVLTNEVNVLVLEDELLKGDK